MKKLKAYRVKDMIAALQEHDPEALVVVEGSPDGFHKYLDAGTPKKTKVKRIVPDNVITLKAVLIPTSWGAY